MKILALLFILTPMLSFGMDRVAALSMLETGDNDRIVGRAGEISRYQILKREWHSVTNSVQYSNPETARAVALKLLERRERSFRAVFHRPPTDFEFYGLWNAPGQVLERRVSRVVAERCRRYANLCEWTGIPTNLAVVPKPPAPIGSGKTESPN
jgi:hypothetical protein